MHTVLTGGIAEAAIHEFISDVIHERAVVARVPHMKGIADANDRSIVEQHLIMRTGGAVHEHRGWTLAGCEPPLEVVLEWDGSVVKVGQHYLSQARATGHI